MMVTREYLRDNPRCIFIFGDNMARKGLAGAASLRTEKNTYGFITKIYPDNHDKSFFKPFNYKHDFCNEKIKLENLILKSQNRIFLVSKIGSGLANRFGIYEKFIKEWREKLPTLYNNVHLV